MQDVTPPVVGWLSFVVPACATLLVGLFAVWWPRRDRKSHELGTSLAKAQENIFRTQQSIIDGLRAEVREMRDLIAGLEEQNRECMAQNTDLQRRVRHLERAVRALGGDDRS